MPPPHSFVVSRSAWATLLYATLMAVEFERQNPAGKPGVRLLERPDLVEELRDAAARGHLTGSATLTQDGLAAAVNACSAAQILAIARPDALREKSILDNLEEQVVATWFGDGAPPRLPGTSGADRLERWTADLNELEAAFHPVYFRP